MWISPFQEPLNLTQTFLRVHITSQANSSMTKVLKFDQTDPIEFDFDPKVPSNAEQLKLSLKMTTNADSAIAFKVLIDANPLNTDIGVVAAIFILIFFNVLINAEVNRDCILFVIKNNAQQQQKNLNDNGIEFIFRLYIERSRLFLQHSYRLECWPHYTIDHQCRM